jgi:hypothetical protein
MVDRRVRAALAAFQAAQDSVPVAQEQARQTIAKARQRVVDARHTLHEAIVAAYLDGARVTELAAATGYGREQIRRILRAAGVEPG